MHIRRNGTGLSAHLLQCLVWNRHVDGLQANSEQASMIDTGTNQMRAQVRGFSILERMCCNVIGFRNPVAGNKRLSFLGNNDERVA